MWRKSDENTQVDTILSSGPVVLCLFHQEKNNSRKSASDADQQLINHVVDWDFGIFSI